MNDELLCGLALGAAAVAALVAGLLWLAAAALAASAPFLAVGVLLSLGGRVWSDRTATPTR